MWDVLSHVRFIWFPFTPPREKADLCYRLLFINAECPQFQQILHKLVSVNRFEDLRRLVSRIRSRMKRESRLQGDLQADMDLIVGLYLAEEDPALATDILATLLRFPFYMFSSEWNVGTNLLFSATSAEDKRAALCFLKAFLLDAPPKVDIV